MKFLTEKVSAWQHILNAAHNKQPVVIYGTGNGADKIFDFCEQNNVPIAGLFASDDFVRGQSFRNIKVEHYTDIVKHLGTNFLLVIAFASELPNILNRFEQLAQIHETIIPHLGLYDNDVVTEKWIAQYNRELNTTYNLLADDLSKQIFTDMLNYKFSGKINYLNGHVTQRHNDLQLLELNSCETYMDLGAFNGDTIKEFLTLTNQKYNKIIAVEADTKNFQKLCTNYQTLNNFYPLNFAIWNEQTELEFNVTGGRQSSIYGKKRTLIPTNTIDNIINTFDLIPSYIKMDIEGAENQALAGATNCLQSYKPKLFIAAYHFDKDLFKIPLKLHELNKDYKIYLRKHPYIPDWEINIIAK